MMTTFIEFISEQNNDPTSEVEGEVDEPLPKNVRKAKMRTAILAARARRKEAQDNKNPMEVRVAASDEKRARLVGRIGDQKEREIKRKQSITGT